MYIYSYLNSRDVSEHCRSIGYQFNAIESAYIIHSCRSISFEEKLRLLQQIIETMPDEKLTDRARRLYSHLDYRTDSFHAALSHYIEVMRNSMQSFLTPEPDTVYCFSYTRIDWHESIDCAHVYSSFEAAKEVLFRDMRGDEEDDPSLYTGFLYKRRIDTEEYLCADISADGMITALCDSRADSERYFFDCIWVKIPVPFKRGDLLYGNNPHQLTPINAGKEPMVLIDIRYQSFEANKNKLGMQRYMAGLDASDMTAWGYWLDHNGKIYEECMHAYHELEYYRGKVKGDVRLLYALGAHMRGEIDSHMLMIASDAIRHERELKATFPAWNYNAGCYLNAGISDIHQVIENWKKTEKHT